MYSTLLNVGSQSVVSIATGNKLSGSRARYLPLHYVRGSPFGGWRTEPTTSLTNRGFTGHRQNNLGSGATDLGLIYMNARYYIPSIGKFTSADTLVPNPSNPQSLNRYAYVLNNPLRFTDPSGHISCQNANLPSNDQLACVATSPPPLPQPTIPDQPMVDFSGFDTLDEYQQAIMLAIQEAALLVGQALADMLNQMYASWNLSATEAFLLVYGGTVLFVWTGIEKSYAAKTISANEIEIYDTSNTIGKVTNKVHWIVHELGHAFSSAVGGTTDATAAFLNHYQVGRLADGGYSGYAGGKTSPRLWQQNFSLEASEQFADMFIGWAYGRWEKDEQNRLTPAGIAMSNYMNGNIPNWLNLVVH